MIFLSEPQTFQADMAQSMEYFTGEYFSSLNSHDLHDLDLPLTSNRAKGGTLVMWKTHLDPYLTIQVPDSSAFLPVIISIPNHRTSIHVALYLPTAGRDAEYLYELAQLKVVLEDLLLRHPNSLLYIRGDANSSKTNPRRNHLFKSFCKEFNLTRVPLHHNTYHHFTGSGKSDSELDVLLYAGPVTCQESLLQLHCQLDNPLMDSHHDLLVSSCSIPHQHGKQLDKSDNLTAPRVENTRHRVIWSEEGKVEYSQMLSELLPEMRNRWKCSSSKAFTSVLLQSTNFLMAQAATATNKVVSLSSSVTPKPARIPKHVRKSANAVARASTSMKIVLSNQSSLPEEIAAAQNKLHKLKNIHRRMLRQTRLHKNLIRDKKFHAETNKAVRKVKVDPTRSVTKLHVGDKVYEDEHVADGFYDSIHSLKKVDKKNLSESSSYNSALETYVNILKVCKAGSKLPPVSLGMANKILNFIRPSVNDIYSITGYHYRYCGQAGLHHFCYLVNLVISDLNHLTVEELNLVWACILHKGHGKNRAIDRSYRTISTCPLISKAIDTYISILYSPKWNTFTAETQFQAKSSSHDLAALTLTETIIHSTRTNNRPVFVIYLDAMSAFDLALREFLINNIYECGIRDHGLLVIDQRLRNRKTICEWNKVMMGPIIDECGVEQGGINSSDFFKIYNNEQISLAQESQLGVPLGPVVVSAIGQADDVALLSNDLHALQALLDLSLFFCQKYHVSLSPGKTKLQVYCSKGSQLEASIAKLTSCINITGDPIKFVEEAEHVGILRSVDGNLPHILSRFTAYRKSLFRIFPAGLAKGHRANPAIILSANSVYGFPVLFSGIASLVLTTTEVGILDQFVKVKLQRLQKLRDKTPACVVMFLGGQLPGKALLHLRQLTIFGMICRLTQSFVYKIAVNQLTSAKQSSGSWFRQIRNLCLLYGLPPAISLLHKPLSKLAFKCLIKSKVISYWEDILRAEALNLRTKSLRYFRPEYMSLTKPHTIWLSCGSNPYETHKAVIQAKMLSGRYVTDQLSRHWTSNKDGICTIPGCSGTDIGTLEHLLLFCPSLAELWLTAAADNPDLSDIINEILSSHDHAPDTAVQFLLDCSSFPAVIYLKQTFGDEYVYPLFYLTRSWCYSMHRARMTKIGLPQYR